MLFSEEFGITRGDGDDWFDPILDFDTKLFVDPFLIFKEPSETWAGAHPQLIRHFDICFKLIAEGNLNPQSTPYKKALALLRFPEPKEFCLGYTAVGTAGAGGGLGYARLIAIAMEDAVRRGMTDLRHFEELGILNEGIGPDRISDLRATSSGHASSPIPKPLSNDTSSPPSQCGSGEQSSTPIEWRGPRRPMICQ